ncbi:MAG: hypothetical protein RL756_1233 [Pseudomonadota bacterium]
MAARAALPAAQPRAQGIHRGFGSQALDSGAEIQRLHAAARPAEGVDLETVSKFGEALHDTE